MFLGELEGERHMSLLGRGSDFDHYRCPLLFHFPELVDGKLEEWIRLSFFWSRPHFTIFKLTWNLAGTQWGQVNPTRSIQCYVAEPNYYLDNFFTLRRVITRVLVPK